MNSAFTEKPTVAAVARFVVLLTVAGLHLCEVEAGERHLTEQRQADSDTDQETVAEFLQRYCFDCHAADTQEANVRLDTLDLSFGTASDNEFLQSVATVVASGQMPPEDAEGPGEDERQLLASSIARRLGEVAEDARRNGNWTRNRRLTAEEYNFTMQSLFGVDAEFADNLPPDPISREGFQNSADLLGLSALQIECYLENARLAVQRYVQFGEPAEQPLRYHVEFEDLYYTTADRYGTRQRAPQPVALDDFEARRSKNLGSSPQYVGPLSAIPPGPFPTEEELRAAIPKLHQQFLAMPECTTTGEMLVRIRAAATPDRHGRYPRMRVQAGVTLGDGDWMDTRSLGETVVTAPLDDPKVYEFRIRMEDVPTKGPLRDEDAYDRLSVFDMVQLFISNVSRDEQAIYALGRGGHPASDSPLAPVETPLSQMADAGVNFLYLDCIEVEMLPGLTKDGAYEWSMDVIPSEQGKKKQRTAASEFLTRFMHRAYRRPVSTAEVAKKIELFDALRESSYSFEESLRETLTAVLVSPHFLFLESEPPSVDASQSAGSRPHRLAARLSYLLWLAPPDERLLQLADDGSLTSGSVLTREAERMLEDPRSRRFLDSFCRQWLRLDKFKNIAVDRKLYTQYDDDLADDTIQETLQYFSEVFNSGSSALELLDSDYAVLNDRLSTHYAVGDVTNGAFQKVSLPEGSVRGGLLTQASLMTMNSDGVDSHPIRRGAWLLDRLLNTPAPPPPPNVPEIDAADPDFRGLSLKERIELHRQPGACQSCHRKIDPWGIAFENFDATGRWREEIQINGHGKSKSKRVDAAVQLPDGRRINGVRELKRYLREERSEQFARALAHHMLTYALGRSLDYADRQQLDAIHNRFAAADHQLKELVLAIVDSDTFRQ